MINEALFPSRTSMTPFSLMIMHQWLGSALLELPSPNAVCPKLRFKSSLEGVVQALESPYSISSSSSTTLLSNTCVVTVFTHFERERERENEREREFVQQLTWGPGWWSPPWSDSWRPDLPWSSSSLCSRWWTSHSCPCTRTARLCAIAAGRETRDH